MQRKTLPPMKDCNTLMFHNIQKKWSNIQLNMDYIKNSLYKISNEFKLETNIIVRLNSDDCSRHVFMQFEASLCFQSLFLTFPFRIPMRCKRLLNIYVRIGKRWSRYVTGNMEKEQYSRLMLMDWININCNYYFFLFFLLNGM